MAQQTNGDDRPSNSGLVNEKTVPCVLDNAAWSGLDTTYDLNDPHSGELLVRRALCSDLPCYALL